MKYSYPQIILGILVLAAAAFFIGKSTGTFAIIDLSQGVSFDTGQNITIATFTVTGQEGLTAFVVPNQTIALANGDKLVPEDVVRIEAIADAPHWTAIPTGVRDLMGTDGIFDYSLRTYEYPTFTTPTIHVPLTINVIRNGKILETQNIDATKNVSSVSFLGGAVVVEDVGKLVTGYVAPSTSDVALLSYKDYGSDSLGGKFSLVGKNAFDSVFYKQLSNRKIWFAGVGFDSVKSFRDCTYRRDADGNSACPVAYGTVSWAGVTPPSGFFATSGTFDTQMLNIKYPFGADGSLYGAIPRGSFPTVLTVRIDDSILRYKYILAESIVPAITNVKLSDSSVTSGYSIRACATVQNVGKARGNMRVTFSGDQVSSSSPGETFSLDAGASTDVCTDVAGGTTIGTCAGTLIVTASDTFSGKSVSKAVCITVDELKFDASGTATDVSGGIIGSADLSGEAAPTVIKATEKTDTNGTSDNTMLYVLIGVIVLVVVGYFLTKKPQGKR